jgi:hypothetical protein
MSVGALPPELPLPYSEDEASNRHLLNKKIAVDLHTLADNGLQLINMFEKHCHHPLRSRGKTIYR